MTIAVLLHKIHFRLRYFLKDSSTNFITLSKSWFYFPLDFFPFMKGKRIHYVLRNGTSFTIRLNTFDIIIIHEIYLLNEYKNILKAIKPSSTVIDIGAHIGIFSVFAAKYRKDVSVVSFEPMEENYQLLRENIQNNHLEQHIVPVKKGVGKKKEKRRLYLNEGNSGGHSLFPNLMQKNARYMNIEILSLEDVFEEHKITVCHLLKMDCEGAEYEILYHAPPRILKKINAIAMEYHANGNVNSLILFLQKNGFTVTRGRKNFPILFAIRET